MAVLTPVTSTRPPNGGGDGSSWQAKFLALIGAPASDTNVNALNAWAASEGTVKSNNPLAISGTRYPGTTTCIAQCGSSSPIMAYSSLDAGTQANAQFLLDNNYGGVVAAFRQNAGYRSIWQAINQSGWCRGCQGGQYPVALARLAEGGAPVNPASVAGSTAAATLTAATGSGGISYQEHCIVNLPSLGPIGGGCLFGSSQARALMGAGLVTAGVLLSMAGMAVLTAALLGHDVKTAASYVPGPVGMVAQTIGKPAQAKKPAPAKKAAPTREAPLSDQDKADLNTQLTAKRQKAEGPSEDELRFRRESRARKRASRPAPRGFKGDADYVA